MEDETEKRTDHAARIGSRGRHRLHRGGGSLLGDDLSICSADAGGVCDVGSGAVLLRELVVCWVQRSLLDRFCAQCQSRALAGCFVLGSTGMTASVIGLFWGLRRNPRKGLGIQLHRQTAGCRRVLWILPAIPLGILGGFVIWSLTRFGIGPQVKWVGTARHVRVPTLPNRPMNAV